MRLHRVVGVVFVALAAMALAACTPVVTAPPTSSSSKPVASPTSAPTQAPVKPPLSELTIGPDGIGDLMIGRPVPDTAPDASLVRWDPTACAPSDPAGAWVANYPDVTAGPWGGAWPFGINTIHGEKEAPIGFIMVTPPTIGTAAGIHVGSTLNQVRAAYPTNLSMLAGEHSDVFWISGTRGTLQIEVPHDTSTVAALSVISAGVAPFAMYGGDAGAPCAT